MTCTVCWHTLFVFVFFFSTIRWNSCLYYFFPLFNWQVWGFFTYLKGGTLGCSDSLTTAPSVFQLYGRQDKPWSSDSQGAQDTGWLMIKKTVFLEQNVIYSSTAYNVHGNVPEQPSIKMYISTKNAVIFHWNICKVPSS